MSEGAQTNGRANGRTWVPVLSILALVSGVSAVITPMYAGLSNEKESRKELEARVKANEDGRAAVMAELAAIKVQFAEVETQFKGAKEQLLSVDSRIGLQTKNLDDKLQQEIAAQGALAQTLRENQKDNIAAVQDLKVRVFALETIVKNGKP